MNSALFFAMLLALVVAAVVVVAAENTVGLAAKVAKSKPSGTSKSPSTVTKSPNAQSNLKKKVMKKKGSPKPSTTTSTFTGGLLFNVNADPCGTGNPFETAVSAAVLGAVTSGFTIAPTVTITKCQAFARRKLTEAEAFKAAVTNEHLTAFTTAVVDFTVAGTPTTSVADVQTKFTGGIENALTAQSGNFPAGAAWTGTASLGPTGTTPVYTTAGPSIGDPVCICDGQCDNTCDAPPQGNLPCCYEQPPPPPPELVCICDGQCDAACTFYQFDCC